MRPDKSDMIMLAANFFWHGLPVDVIVAAGDRPKKKALDWLMRFSSEKKRLLIYQIEEDWFAFGPPAFQAEIAARIGRGESRGPTDRLIVSSQSRGTIINCVSSAGETTAKLERRQRLGKHGQIRARSPEMCQNVSNCDKLCTATVPLYQFCDRLRIFH
jgi:hypothetical protein